MKLHYQLFCLFFCHLIPDQGYSQNFQQILQSEITASNPGILFTLESKDGSLSWSGAAGINDLDQKDSLTINRTFRIASVTKTYVAASILRLMEKGVLNLDDPISMHLSQPQAEILAPEYDLNQITIRQILRHAAGFFDHTHAPEFFETVLGTPSHEWTRTEQLRMCVEKGEPIGPPGQQFSYSDTGYVILGELIETYTGKSLDGGIKELLGLERLGLHRTDFERIDPLTDQQRIHQYFEGRDTYTFSPTTDYFGGGGLLSNTRELVDFFQALFGGKIFKNPETLNIMLESVSYPKKAQLDYQMGMFKVMINGMEAYTHSGFWGTQVLFIPKLNLFMATNYSGGWRGSAVAPVFEKIILEMGKRQP